LVAAMANWAASQRATQFAVAATDHSALGSGKIRSVEMRWDGRGETVDVNVP